MMTANTSIKFNIDANFLAMVERESYQILWQQRQAHNQRWQSASFMNKSRSILRLLLLVLSLVGSVLSLMLLVYPSSCPRWFYAKWFLFFFILAGIFAYFMPKIDARYFKALGQMGEKSCQKMARRFVKKAFMQVPFEAEYVIRGDSVTYFRCKDEQWHQIWSRRIKGIAIQGEKVTLVFRKPSSLAPSMLVMHESREDIAAVLDELGIVCRGI